MTDASTPRTLLVWLCVTSVSAAAAGWALPDLVDPTGPSSFEVVLVRGCALLVTGCSAWVSAVTALVTIEILRRNEASRSRPAVPGWTRSALLLACGAIVVGAAGPASALATAGPGEDTSAHAPSPAASTPRNGFVADVLERRVTQRSSPTARIHTVVRGDSLWAIAADRLGNPRRWPEIYRLNATRIGADPDLVVPAVRLTLPETTTKETR